MTPCHWEWEERLGSVVSADSSSSEYTLKAHLGMPGAMGSGSCTWSHFSLMAALRSRCRMLSYTWGNRHREVSTARSSHSGQVAEPGLKLKPCYVP